MIGWAVAAAGDTGAGKVVVVEGPGRVLEPVLDGRVKIAVQERSLGLFRRYLDEIWRIPTGHFDPLRASSTSVERATTAADESPNLRPAKIDRPSYDQIMARLE
jgi:hypothetical protein